jgi:hypothetical protein
MEHRRGIFAATALIFDAGTAGARGAAGNLDHLDWFGLGLFCKNRCGLFATALDFAQFGERAGEDAEGSCAGAFDGLLGLFDREGAVFQSQGGFDGGATAESPGGVDDFGGEGLFDGAHGSEVGFVGGGEFGVDRGFLAQDEVACGEKTGGDGVAGDTGFALIRNRTSRCQRVRAVGDQLGIGCHEFSATE